MQRVEFIELSSSSSAAKSGASFIILIWRELKVEIRVLGLEGILLGCTLHSVQKSTLQFCSSEAPHLPCSKGSDYEPSKWRGSLGETVKLASSPGVTCESGWSAPLGTHTCSLTYTSYTPPGVTRGILHTSLEKTPQ